MEHFIIYLTIFVLLISAIGCRVQKSHEIEQLDIEAIHKQNVQDSILVTGWYYIIDEDNGFERQLDKTDKFYFIDPKPIVVKEHFEKIKIYKTNFRGQYEDYIGLSIQINQKYADLWADATEKYIGKQLGLIIDNKLVNAPRVNSKIPNGITALNRDVYDREELENFKKQLMK